jgi:hypothetical protein
MILWIIALSLTFVFFLLLLFVFLRKLHFDAIHRNLLDLEEAYGGKVIRGGFAARPRYVGKFKGKTISVAITSAREKNQGRKYFIEVNLQASPKTNFSILDAKLLEDQNILYERKEKMIQIANGNFVLEVVDKNHLRFLKIKQIGEAISPLNPFEFILASKSGIMFERISTDLNRDTDIRQLGHVIKQINELRKVVE